MEKTNQNVNGTRREYIAHGVVLREHEVTISRYAHQSAKIALTSYVRKKRLYSIKDHYQSGKKRIFKRLRKTAKCIIRKLWNKKCNPREFHNYLIHAIHMLAFLRTTSGA